MRRKSQASGQTIVPAPPKSKAMVIPIPTTDWNTIHHVEMSDDMPFTLHASFMIVISQEENVGLKWDHGRFFFSTVI